MPPTMRPLLRNLPTVAPVPQRTVLSLAGSQATEFLNGILASSVREPQRGPFYSAFLHAQGRVLYDVFVYPRTTSDGKRDYLIEHDSRASPLLPFLRRYVLRSKVKLRDVSEEYNVWQSWGSDAELAWETPRRWNWARSGAVEPEWDSDNQWPWGTDVSVIRDRRAVGMGQRMLVPRGDRPSQASTHDLAPSEAYTLHRILHGVPEGVTDIPPNAAFPMDSNLDVMGGLDFRKGCYVGQELTVRTYHTGVVRKRILPVILHKPDTIPSDVAPDPAAPSFASDLDIRASVVRAPDDARPMPRPRGTGKLLTNTQGVGLALLRLEHVEGAQSGDLRLEFEVGPEGQSTKWMVSHWWPDWWPTRPVEHE